MASKSIVKSWIQRLLPACDGDLGHTKRQLEWLKEKVTLDLSGDSRTQPFCELDIVTRPPTLIPRWETEEWTYKVIEMLKNQLSTVQKPLRILDVCTGSGCISLALAKHLPKDSVHITGLDISTKAISLSHHNLDLHRSQLQNPVEFHVQDVFQYTPQDDIHLIVSNPPYITDEEYETLDPDVKNWEDARALVAPDQGTRVHQGVIQVAKYLN
ncbi:hypothetical protein G6F42_011968 [Rhizopus arrhizus]|nr:hypothetical protein G6F42_011968 [Rhizopus arrhizus]